MTGSTPNHAFPYPEGGDKVATHTDIRTLATAVDTGLTAFEDVAEDAANAVDAKYASLLAPLSISSTTHLDTLIEPNKYRTISSAIAGDTSLGYPEGAIHGVLTVERVTTNDPPYIVQTWLDTWNTWIARRRLYQGAWSEWVKDPTISAVDAVIDPLSARVAALEDSASGTTGVQALRFRPVTSDYRPDAFATPAGTVSYWSGPNGIERIPWTYMGDGYVGRIGDAAGYSTMQVKKVENSNEVEVSCLNPDTGKHVTHRVQGNNGGDIQRRFEEGWVGTYTETTVSKDLLILPRSNIEWAFQIDVDGNRQFAPYHGSASARVDEYEPAVFTDANGHPLDLASLPLNGVLTDVHGFKVRQRLYITHPDSGDTRWAAVDEVRTIAPDGMIQSEAVITFLEDTTIGNNYGTMTPVAAGTFDQLHIQGGTTYPVATTPPGSTQYVNIAERHDATSALFTSTSAPDAFVATAILDPDATLQRGGEQEETGATALRLELRANGLVKLYPTTFAAGSVIPAGTVWRVGAQWRYGETDDPGQYA